MNKGLNSNLAIVEVLSHPGFRSLWFGQIFSQLSINTLIFVLALRLYQQSLSNAVVSGLFLVYAIPAVFLGLAAGSIVDKLENKKVLFYCDLIRAMLVLSLIFNNQQVIFIYLITLFNSIITQFYVPAEAPAIPYLVPSKLILTANSLFSFTYYSSLAIGSIFAGPLLRVFGPEGIFIFLALLFFIAAFNISRVPAIRDKKIIILSSNIYSPKYILGRIFANIYEAIKYVRKIKGLQEALMLLTGTQIVIALLGTLGPGFADRMLKIDIRDASLVITGPAVIGLISGALWVGSFGSGINKQKLINGGVITAGFTLLITALIVRLINTFNLPVTNIRTFILPLVFCLFFIFGFANSMLDVPSNSILQQESSGNIRGRIYGILASAVGGFGILPVVIGGILADKIGVGKVIFILGFIITSYGIYRKKYVPDIIE